MSYSIFFHQDSDSENEMSAYTRTDRHMVSIYRSPQPTSQKYKIGEASYCRLQGETAQGQPVRGNSSFARWRMCLLFKTRLSESKAVGTPLQFIKNSLVAYKSYLIVYKIKLT